MKIHINDYVSEEEDDIDNIRDIKDIFYKICYLTKKEYLKPLGKQLNKLGFVFVRSNKLKVLGKIDKTLVYMINFNIYYKYKDILKLKKMI